MLFLSILKKIKYLRSSKLKDRTTQIISSNYAVSVENRFFNKNFCIYQSIARKPAVISKICLL